MPIEYVNGDLFKSDCNVIGHGCNCFNSFGAGIALQMMKQHVPAWLVDQATLKGDVSKLGGLTMAIDTTSSPSRVIFNLYTQYSFSRSKVSADYSAIRRSLTAMKKYVDRDFADCKLGLPKIGAGLAMGDWETIAAIIADVFYDRIVYVYYL